MAEQAWREAERILGAERFADWDDNREGRLTMKVTFYRHGTARPTSQAGQAQERGLEPPKTSDRVVELPAEETGEAYADVILATIQDAVFVTPDGRALFGTIAQYSGSFRDAQLFCFLSHIDGQTRPFGGASVV